MQQTGKMVYDSTSTMCISWVLFEQGVCSRRYGQQADALDSRIYNPYFGRLKSHRKPRVFTGNIPNAVLGAILKATKYSRKLHQYLDSHTFWDSLSNPSFCGWVWEYFDDVGLCNGHGAQVQ